MFTRKQDLQQFGNIMTKLKFPDVKRNMAFRIYPFWLPKSDMNSYAEEIVCLSETVSAFRKTSKFRLIFIKVLL